VLVKGPYVTLANDFAREHTLKQLHDEGVGHKDLQHLHWRLRRGPTLSPPGESVSASGGDAPQFYRQDWHRQWQDRGVPAADSLWILKLRADGVKGTKAILLYPMNALANDQLVRLRKADSRFRRGRHIRDVYRRE